MALTDCSAGEGHCGIESTCHTGRTWQRVNLAIRRSLHDVTLAQLAGLDGGNVRLPALERELRALTARTAPRRCAERRICPRAPNK